MVTIQSTPRRWLVVQASALLQSVAVSNYACFAGSRTPDFRPQTPGSPLAMQVALILRDAGGDTRLTVESIRLANSGKTDIQMIWNGYDRERHVQVFWVWDFYRIQSIAVLRVELPPESSTELGDPWQKTLDAIRALGPGAAIELDVQSACGDLRQPHKITEPLKEWIPSA